MLDSWVECSSTPPSVSSEAPALMVVLMSTQPKSPALQQFFKAQINLPSSPFSIKKVEGDWFTLVKLRDEHKWYSALTGVALQVATETLNKVITMPKSTHAVWKWN